MFIKVYKCIFLVFMISFITLGNISCHKRKKRDNSHIRRIILEKKWQEIIEKLAVSLEKESSEKIVSQSDKLSIELSILKSSLKSDDKRKARATAKIIYHLFKKKKATNKLLKLVPDLIKLLDKCIEDSGGSNTLLVNNLTSLLNSVILVYDLEKRYLEKFKATILKLLKHNNYFMRKSAVSSVFTLSRKVDFTEAIPLIIQDLKLRRIDFEVAEAAAKLRLQEANELEKKFLLKLVDMIKKEK